MKEHPILFRPPLVRAILDGHKTQTRRVLKTRFMPPPDTIRAARNGPASWCYEAPGLAEGIALGGATCPHGDEGDRLWVREMVTLVRGHGERDNLHGPMEATIRYADGETRRVVVPDEDRTFPWKRLTRPGIHMPRWACRLVLEITQVRLQRLQEISEDDAKAEGTWREWHPDTVKGAWAYRAPFSERWNQINEPRGFGWAANPWVWAITFRSVAP